MCKVLKVSRALVYYVPKKQDDSEIRNHIIQIFRESRNNYGKMCIRDRYKNGIAKWNVKDIPTKLWPISPLSKVWGIGSRLEKRLNNLGIFTVYDLAHQDPNFLKKKFGIIGKELWEHANGIDNSLSLIYI